MAAEGLQTAKLNVVGGRALLTQPMAGARDPISHKHFSVLLRNGRGLDQNPMVGWGWGAAEGEAVLRAPPPSFCLWG